MSNNFAAWVKETIALLYFIADEGICSSFGINWQHVGLMQETWTNEWINNEPSPQLQWLEDL